jgi:hypothetical protein
MRSLSADECERLARKCLELFAEGRIGELDRLSAKLGREYAPGTDSRVFARFEELRNKATQPPVFVSFSDVNRNEALDIVTYLESHGIKCWISYRDVPRGGDFQQAIVAALEAATAMILIFSEAANNSTQIAKELAIADGQSLFILPVRIESFKPTKGFKYQLANRQWIDLFDDREQNLKLLVATLRKRQGL